MGIGDKLKFWKRGDFTLDTGKIEQQPYDLGAPSTNQFSQDPLLPPTPDPSQQPTDSFQHEVFGKSPQQYPSSTPFPGSAPTMHVPEAQYAETAVHPRDVELILAKLDAIKSELDALHQRVRKIEQVTEPQNQRKYW